MRKKVFSLILAFGLCLCIGGNAQATIKSYGLKTSAGQFLTTPSYQLPSIDPETENPQTIAASFADAPRYTGKYNIAFGPKFLPIVTGDIYEKDALWYSISAYTDYPSATDGDKLYGRLKSGMTLKDGAVKASSKTNVSKQSLSDLVWYYKVTFSNESVRHMSDFNVHTIDGSKKYKTKTILVKTSLTEWQSGVAISLKSLIDYSDKMVAGKTKYDIAKLQPSTAYLFASRPGEHKSKRYYVQWPTYASPGSTRHPLKSFYRSDVKFAYNFQ